MKGDNATKETGYGTKETRKWTLGTGKKGTPRSFTLWTQKDKEIRLKVIILQMRQENGLQRQEKRVTPKAIALIAEIRLFYIVDGRLIRLIKLQKMIKWIIEGLKYFRSQVLQRNRKNLGRAQVQERKK